MDRLAPLRKNVRREREARGWSMSELARVAGLRPSTVYRLETGSQPPRLDSLIAIADGASRPSSRDALDAATSGRLQHTGVTALSEDRDLRAGLGLKRAELGRLWNLSDVLARAGIVLDTPLQAVRALDLLRSLGPEAIPRKSASDAASTVRRRPGSTGNPDRAPRKPKQTP
jgi:transcriptional regulator with XRE-family HTH domain